jgi:hypothetical protein
MENFYAHYARKIRVKIGQAIDLFGALDRNRTCDLPLRRRMLYPLSYQGKVAGWFSHTLKTYLTWRSHASELFGGCFEGFQSYVGPMDLFT